MYSDKSEVLWEGERWLTIWHDAGVELLSYSNKNFKKCNKMDIP